MVCLYDLEGEEIRTPEQHNRRKLEQELELLPEGMNVGTYEGIKTDKEGYYYFLEMSGFHFSITSGSSLRGILSTTKISDFCAIKK